MSKLAELTDQFRKLSDAEGKALIFLKLIEIEEKLNDRSPGRSSSAPADKLPVPLPLDTINDLSQLEECLDIERDKEVLVREI